MFKLNLAIPLISIYLLAHSAFTQTLQTHYVEITGWNMPANRDRVINLPSAITISNIVSVEATIYSDPDVNGKIEGTS